MSESSKSRWSGFIATVPGTGMAFMDQTILPVALPTISKEMIASPLALQWSINAYLLTIAIFTLVGGKLGDRFGHRKVYLIGMSIFVLFSALCGLTPTVDLLVLFRAFQGFGAAIMFPSQTALFVRLFPAKVRGRATGLSASLGAVFIILGPLIGGYLTEAISWRAIFWVNIPLGMIGFILSLFFLPSSKPGKGEVDKTGFLYFATSSSLMTVLFMQLEDWGAVSLKTAICLVVMVFAIVLLILRERKAEHPFLDLTLFKKPVFSAINLSISISQFIMMVSVFRIIYIQEILGYTPSQTGIIASISSLPILFFSNLGGYLSDKVSPRLPVALGFILWIFSFFWLGFFSTPNLYVLFTATLLGGMGAPLIFTPSYSAAMSAVPPEKLGVAFGLVGTLRMLAGTIGLALINLFVETVQKHYLPKVGWRDAQIASFSAIHFALGTVLVLAFIVSLFLHTRASAHHPPHSSAEGWD